MTVFCEHLALNHSHKWCGPSRQAAWTLDSPLRTKSHPAGSIPTSQPGGPPYWTRPLAFGLIVYRTTRFQSVAFLDFPILIWSSQPLTDSTLQGDGMGLLESWRGLPGGTSVIIIGCIIYYTVHHHLETRSLLLSSPCQDGTVGTGSTFSQLPSRYKWQPPHPSPPAELAGRRYAPAL